MDPINILLCLLEFIPYHLALAYIGVSFKFRSTVIPGLILSFFVIISKIAFNTPPILHTVIIMFFCAFLLHFFNKIDFLLSVIGSLLSYTTLVLGSLLITCPLLIHLGIEISKKTTGLPWVFLNIAEIITPALVLIALKASKMAPVKYITRI